MTPMNKTKMKNDAEVRATSFVLQARAKAENEEQSYIVEGYAANYERYELFRFNDDEVYYEQFSKENFESADKGDVIFCYDHSGKVMARTSNGTLKLEVDDKGLKVTVDLSKTEAARQMYEEIAAGMVTKMSWRFAVDDDAYQFDEKTNTITYSAIRKIYDVSAVSIPANDSTEISSRSKDFINGEIEKLNARRDAEQRRAELKAEILSMLGGKENDT